ncbi:NUDIX domain-containing protein [Kitasatospora sp. NPDC088556]|uniref:NUDIX domain-containing protein n=1 Tax=Kitasatospora sp. NPDC088556 TaxID=3364076 RepID=UPI00381C7154
MAHSDIQVESERRIGAQTLIRDSEGRVLLVQPTYRNALQLPGGAVHRNEQVADAAMRELAEETGLHRLITHHFGVDQIPPNPSTGAVEGYNFVCDGGIVTEAERAALSIPVGASQEIKVLEWVTVDELVERAEPYMVARVLGALSLADHGLRQPLFYIGEPASERHAG